MSGVKNGHLQFHLHHLQYSASPCLVSYQEDNKFTWPGDPALIELKA